MSSVIARRESRHGSGRWEVVRSALDSNARTFRYCLMVTVFPVAVAVIAELMRHTRLCGLFTAVACDNPDNAMRLASFGQLASRGVPVTRESSRQSPKPGAPKGDDRAGLPKGGAGGPRRGSRRSRAACTAGECPPGTPRRSYRRKAPRVRTVTRPFPAGRPARYRRKPSACCGRRFCTALGFLCGIRRPGTRGPWDHVPSLSEAEAT